MMNLVTKVLLLLLFSGVTIFAQDTFTANSSGNWTAITWTIVRDVDNPGTNTYPGQNAGNQYI